jgi:hypothetical protein
MDSAKDILLKPISRNDADRIVRACHYSGKVVQNSQLHFGVFLNGKCGGAMQFGPSLDKRKIQGLVRATGWNDFIELNRMAFADWLPRNSESRAISIAMRLLRKHYANIEWVISFADATQCGDGTIYRASGFVLTAIKDNSQLFRLPSGDVLHKMNFEVARPTPVQVALRKKHKMPTASVEQVMKAEGASALAGFQLRYIYFLNPEARSRLTVPEIPFSEIARRGASMYRGQAISRAGSDTKDTAGFQPAKGGSTPTPALHSDG